MEGVGVIEVKYFFIVIIWYNVLFLLDVFNVGNVVVSGILCRLNGKKWRKKIFRREREERI